MASVAFCSGNLTTTTTAHKFRSVIPCTRNALISCKVSFEENGKPGVQSLTSNQEILPKFFIPYDSERYRMKKDESKLRVFSGTANPALSKEIACYMGLDLGDIEIKRFADGEIYVQLCESVRGCDVFLVQPTCPPANENLMELLVMIDACRRASAKTVTAVIPYFGYARSDRKNQGRESISAKLVANLITEAGADRVLACDLHSGQSIGYFDIPVNHIHGQPVILDYLASKAICVEDLVVVSPDVGGVARARAFAKKLSDAPLAIVDKRRHGHNVAEVMNLIGDVKGKVAVMVDDMIDTAGTISKGAALLHHEGAKEVYACCTHGVFSPPAIERLSSGLFQEVIITNSIPVSEQNCFPQLTILSVANLVGEAIWRVHDDHASSLKILFIFVAPCFTAEAAYKIWWYTSGATAIPFFGNTIVSHVFACTFELASWLYRTVVFFLVCVLFRLICHLQILRLQDFAKVFHEDSDVESVLREHLRIRRHLRIISHRWRVFILWVLILVTVSQFASLLDTTRPNADLSIFKAGELALVSVSLLAGLMILLKSATRITHKAQGVTCLATKWHVCATIESFDPPDVETETPTVGNNQVFRGGEESSSDGEDVGSEDELDSTKLIPAFAYSTISFQKRQALVTYLENNKAGITVFGFMLDRSSVHTIAMIEMSLVLWLLGKTIGIS